MKPNRYYVATQVDENGGVTYPCDTNDLRKARRVAKKVDGTIYERMRFRDVTPASAPRGLLWEHEDVVID